MSAHHFDLYFLIAQPQNFNSQNILMGNGGDLVAVLLIEVEDLLGKELALRLNVSAQFRELRGGDSFL